MVDSIQTHIALRNQSAGIAKGFRFSLKARDVKELMLCQIFETSNRNTVLTNFKEILKHFVFNQGEDYHREGNLIEIDCASGQRNYSPR